MLEAEAETVEDEDEDGTASAPTSSSSSVSARGGAQMLGGPPATAVLRPTKLDLMPKPSPATALRLMSFAEEGGLGADAAGTSIVADAESLLARLMQLPITETQRTKIAVDVAKKFLAAS